MTARRSSGEIGPIRDAGGSTYARSTTFGRPLSSRNDINPSPTASSVIAFSVSICGLPHIVSPAARLEQVVDIQHGLADEAIGPLLLERQEAALNCPDRRGGYVAVACRQLRRVVAHVRKQRAQVLEVEQQQPVVVGELERQRQH